MKPGLFNCTLQDEPFIVPPGGIIYDSMESYVDQGGLLDGRNRGHHWRTPYSDRNQPFGIYYYDSMELYRNGAALNGLNAFAWPTPYADRECYRWLLAYDSLEDYGQVTVPVAQIGSTDYGTNTTPAVLSGKSWQIPVNPANSQSHDPADQVLGPLISDPVLNTVTLLVRGVVECKAYAGEISGSVVPGTSNFAFQITGTLSSGGIAVPTDPFNEYLLQISDPPALYTLNNASPPTAAFEIDYNLNVQMSAGATVTLTARTIDGYSYPNSSRITVVPRSNEPPIQVPQTPYFEGQWLQADATSIAPTTPPAALPFYRQITLIELAVIKNYTITNSGTATNTLTDWKFEGSTDLISWTTLDIQTGQSLAPGQSANYTPTDQHASQFYRFEITGTSDAQIPRLEDTVLYPTAVGPLAALNGGTGWASPYTVPLIFPLQFTADTNGLPITVTMDIAPPPYNPPTQIYYTTNGSIPDTGSTLYTGPVVLAQATVLSGAALATGFESVVQQAYPITTPLTAYLGGGTARNDFSGRVGMYFRVIGSTLAIWQVARFKRSGNNQIHTIYFVDASDSSDLIAVTIDMSNGQDNQFYYVNCPTQSSPLLIASRYYFMFTTEEAGGDTFLNDNNTCNFIGAIQVLFSAYGTPGNYSFGAQGSFCFGPLSFTYSHA